MTEKVWGDMVQKNTTHKKQAETQNFAPWQKSIKIINNHKNKEKKKKETIKIKAKWVIFTNWNTAPFGLSGSWYYYARRNSHHDAKVDLTSAKKVASASLLETASANVEDSSENSGALKRLMYLSFVLITFLNKFCWTTKNRCCPGNSSTQSLQCSWA